MVTDDLDKRLLQHLSSGISSYEDLARDCDVTRNTVYRRIAILEKKRIIKRIVRSVLDYEQLDIAMLSIGATVAEAEQEEVAALLRNNKYVKFLWRTFGHNNIVLLVFCSKGSEGEAIHSLTGILEGFGATKVNVSVAFKLDKMDLSPFSEDLENEQETILQLAEPSESSGSVESRQ
jgi:DNA-binding Lrp family transcriptional regulator